MDEKKEKVVPVDRAAIMKGFETSAFKIGAKTVPNRGRTFTAENKEAGQKVAVKKISLVSLQSSDVESIRNGIETFNKTPTPHCVQYYGSYSRAGEVCIVMSLAEFGDLTTYLNKRKGKPFEQSELFDWMSQLALGLQSLHAKGIIHRNIKPYHILLGKGRVMLLSGITFSTNLAPTWAATKDIASGMYLAPEIINGKPHTMLTDIYSLGLVFLLLATQIAKPFKADGLNQLKSNILMGRREKATYPKDFPSDLKEIINRMISADEKRRPTLNEILSVSALVPSVTKLTYVEKEKVPKVLKVKTVDGKFGTDLTSILKPRKTMDPIPEKVEPPKKTPVKEQPSKIPASKTPKKEIPTKEIPTKESQTKIPMRSTPLKKPPVKEPPKKEVPVKEPPKKVPVKEPPKKVPVKEQPKKEVPVKEEAKKEIDSTIKTNEQEKNLERAEPIIKVEIKTSELEEKIKNLLKDAKNGTIPDTLPPDSEDELFVLHSTLIDYSKIGLSLEKREQEVSYFQDKVNELTTDLTAKTKKIEYLGSENKSRTEQMHLLQSILADKDRAGSLNQLTLLLTQSEDILSTLRDKQVESEKQITNLELKLKMKDSEIAQHQATCLDTHERLIKELEMRIENLNVQLTRKIEECAAKNILLEKRTQTLDEISSKYSTLNSNYSAIKAEFDIVDERAEKLDAILAETDEQKITDEEQRKEKCQKGKTQLKNISASFTSLINNYNRAFSDFDNITTLFKSALSNKDNIIEKIQQARDSKLNQEQISVAEKEKLISRNKQLESDLEYANKHIAQLSSQLAESNITISKLTEDLKANSGIDKTEFDDLQYKVKQLNLELKRKSAQLDRAQKQYTQSVQDEKEASALKIQVESLKLELEQSKYEQQEEVDDNTPIQEDFDSELAQYENEAEQPSQEEPSQEEPSQEEPSQEEPSQEEPSQEEPSQEEPPPPDSCLTCARCHLAYEKSENTDNSCLYHTGDIKRNKLGGGFWSCCFTKIDSKGCQKAAHVEVL